MQGNLLPHRSGKVSDPLQYLTFERKKINAAESCTIGVSNEIQAGRRVCTIS